MKRINWPVGDHGIRPAGKPTECFYCRAPKGEQHKQGCVIRSRTVVVRAIVEYVIGVPEDNDIDLIEFGRNEGTWCAGNMVQELQSLKERLDEAGMCMCSMVEYEFVREATPEDEEESRLFCETLPS